MGPKRYLTVLVGVFVVAALMAPGTSANVKGNDEGWHEAIPNIPIPLESKAECAVTGFVNLVDDPATDDGDPATNEDFETKGQGHGVGAEPAHSFYEFQDVLITCQGNPGFEHYSGTYEVRAQGGTDGLVPNPENLEGELDPNHPKLSPGTKADKKTDHGENLDQGWSHSAQYCDAPGQPAAGNINKGDIAVQKLGSTQQAVPCKNPVTDLFVGGASWVKFVRGWNQGPDGSMGGPGLNLRGDGERVVAWGLLDWDPDKPSGKAQDCFRADLLFEPLLTGNKGGDPLKPVVVFAALEGTAVIYNLGDFTDAKTLATPGVGCDIPNPSTSIFKKPSGSSPGGGNGNGNGGGGTRGPNG